ncbi:hypothetical protein C8Q75DRAFT_760737 [Abortiporus biennis]|nr:hypothetical protein C8Q75DRAFT_760737 [Abortiporus biennis]
MSTQDLTSYPVIQRDLSGKTVAIIGANTGIGLEAAKHFARMNPARLILGCRTHEKGTATASLIEKETGYSKAESWPIELSDFSTVRAFTERFEKDDVPLDFLINNAGIVAAKYEQTIDGWESTIQVNYLSQTLLTILLLPRLLDTAKKHSDVARVVIVSSLVHSWTDFRAERVPFDKVLHTLNSPDDQMKRYEDTKLSIILFVRAFAERFSSTAPLVIDTVCPGFCASDILRHVDTSMFDPEAMKLAHTPEVGSRQLIYAALAPTPEDEAKGIKLDQFKGAYISQTTITPPSDWVLSEEGKKVQNGIWEETIEILSKVDLKVTAILQEYKLC